MLNLGAVMKAFDAVMMFRDAAKRLKSDDPPETGLTRQPLAPGSMLATQLEATLTNVVVAALKEAFDRDRARLDLERAQLEEQQRRAEAAQRQELRRQVADRELGRLRLLGGTALAGWIASIALLGLRAGAASMPARVALAVGWCLLLGALATAFTAQGRVSALAQESDQPLQAGGAGTAAIWLLVAGLAAIAVSLLL
jgi:hypothetical protein